MYSKEEIRGLFGRREIARIEARQRGGLSGQKGTRFEDFFAVFRLAEELAFCYSNATSRFKNVRRSTVRAQVFAIIDDVAVEMKNPRMVEHYQLKNVQNLRWTLGVPSIGEDFVRQSALCAKVGLRSRLYLVVPTQSLRCSMQSTASSKVSKCAIIIVFPNVSLSLLVQTHRRFRNALIKLSPFGRANAENEKLVSLAKFLCGHWSTADNEMSIDNLAIAMETDAGAFCRPMKGTRRIPSDVRKLLSSIRGFKWTLRKGFLFWAYGKTDSGRYPHHCWTREFDRLLARIRQNRPSSFETIEGELR